MSKLEDLIAELCPNGVEYKTIGDIAVDIYRGAGITRDQVTSDGIPCVRYGEIYTTYGIWFDDCVSRTSEESIANRKYFDFGDILFAITGESVEEIAKSCAYVGHERCLAGGDIVILKHNQNPKYLSYVLSTTAAQKQKSKGKVKSKVVHSSVPAIKKISIPLPPLPVQCEIVRILDNFAELTEELTEELTARKKQYDYYRKELLTFDDDVSIMKIGDVADCYSGATPKTDKKEYWEKGSIPWMSSGEVNLGQVYSTEKKITKLGLDKCSTKMVPTNTVVVALAGQGKTRGMVAITRIPLCTNQSLCSIIPNEKVNSNFLYYYLKTQYQKLRLISSGDGTRGGLNLKMIKEYLVPIPPLEEQERIVAILDRFDALCNDLSSGLPAEIEARRKQYEYYRDKLLTFKEMTL